MVYVHNKIILSENIYGNYVILGLYEYYFYKIYNHKPIKFILNSNNELRKTY